jgi:hypothetical protein
LKAISYIGFDWQVLLEIIMTVQASNSQTNLTPAQAAMQELWEAHVQYEFGTHNTEDALAMMVEDAYVNHIPVMTGGVGKPAV